MNKSNKLRNDIIKTNKRPLLITLPIISFQWTEVTDGWFLTQITHVYNFKFTYIYCATIHRLCII